VKPRRVVVNDRMQRGYTYVLAEPPGENFDAEFRPELTPSEMLKIGVFGGKFSPVVLDAVPAIHEAALPFFAVWSSADPIVDNGRSPSYVFRLALRDSLGMPKMLQTAEQRGHHKVGLLLANTGWGRSNLSAAERHVARAQRPAIAQVAWHNWGEKSLLQRYQSLRAAGAQAIVLACTELELVVDVDANVLPIYDSTRIHAEKAAEWILGG